MRLDSVGDVIATRTFLIPEDNDRNVILSIGKPQKFDDGDDFYCPFQITGIGNEKVKYAGGVDAVQALLLVIKMIRSDMKYYNRTHNINIKWDIAGPGDLGLDD